MATSFIRVFAVSSVNQEILDPFYASSMACHNLLKPFDIVLAYDIEDLYE